MLAPLILVAALLLAACGGSGPGYGGSGSSTAASDSTAAGDVPKVPANGEAEESGNAYVALASALGLGLVLVDSQGHVLYAFSGDRGTSSSCDGACAEAWPPLLTEGPPQPSNGASAAKLGTTERKDGRTQVTYAGHPLYTYAADGKPGEANGNGVSAFGGQWHALKGSGAEAG